MNVLIINNVYPSKADPTAYVFVENQALALKKYGLTPIVLDIDLRSYKHKRKYGFFSEYYHGVKVYRYSLPLGYVHNQAMVRVLNKILAKIAYKKIIKHEKKIDVVHAHFGILSGYAALSIHKKYGVPYVITEHHSRVLNMQDEALLKYKKIYDEAECVIVVGSGLKQKLDKIVNKETTIIPNVIDDEKFNIIDSIEKNTNFTFLSVGHLIDSKNHEMLIKAFAKLQKKYNDTELIIIGEGNLKNYLINLSNELKIKNIKFIDRVENDKLPEFYNKANCFVLPSNFETFGVVYAESMCCGTPVICTKCGGPEFFINENNGYLIENNLDELTKTMIKMIDSAEKFSKKDIRDSILKICSEKEFFNKMKKVYDGILKNEN